MGGKVWNRDSSHGSRPEVDIFELEAFTWSAPDELHVAGRFIGINPATQDVPELVVHGSGETHVLAPLPDGERWPPGDGAPWRATFGWDEPPTPIDAAELRIGELVLALPQPGSGTAPAASTPAPAPAPAASSAPGDRLREQADLLLAREELSRVHAAHDAVLGELARVKEQLQDERHARAADSERFRADIDALRAMAEETITAEREAAESLGGELAALREERDAALARVEPLEAAAREVEDLRADFERVSERLQSIRAISEGA